MSQTEAEVEENKMFWGHLGIYVKERNHKCACDAKAEADDLIARFIHLLS
jgi:hypothetical protein